MVSINTFNRMLRVWGRSECGWHQNIVKMKQVKCNGAHNIFISMHVHFFKKVCASFSFWRILKKMLMVLTIVEKHWSLNGKWKILLFTFTFACCLEFAVNAYVLKKWHCETDIFGNSPCGAPNSMCKLWFVFNKRMVYRAIIF